MFKPALGRWLTIAICLLSGRMLLPGRPAQDNAGPNRPPIIGIAHIGLKTSDLAAAQKFYGDVLGFDHFSLDKPTGGLMLNYYKVNDHQYIEIYPGLTGDEDRMTHFAFETTNVRQLRDYLAAHGVNVPATLKPGLDRNMSMMIKDPEGHEVEFVQYMPNSLHGEQFGKLLSDRRIGKRMIHVGVTVHDRPAEDKFYRDVLGFVMTWYGGKTDDSVDWVDMRVPNGTDWLEYMLNTHNPSPKQLGVMHHFSLGVDAIQPVYKEVLARGYQPSQPPKIGRDGKWQLNLYDPDFTRAEVMEFKPVEKPCCSPFVNLTPSTE
ncbi:MAG: VOC family protein [Bryobacteraceae bacterium]